MRSTRRGSSRVRVTPHRNTVFLHIGAPMTGAAGLRACLARHRRSLTRSGVLYPASHLGHDGGHLDAVLDVLGLAGDGPAPAAGAWDRLAAVARDWRRGTVVVSHELLADATHAQAERVVSSFGDAEVHVVYAARSLGRQVPLAWQEWVHNGGTAPFASYVERVVARDEHRMSQVFWASHDVGEVLGRWSGLVPAERVHLLTVPGADEEAVLWDRFAGTVGIDPRRFRRAALRRHAPLGLPESEVLRLLNAESGGRPDPVGVDRVRRALAHSPGAAPALPVVHASWLREEADRQVAAVRRGGYHVVGDLTELLPGPEVLAGSDAQVTPPLAGVLAAQTRALARLAGAPDAREGPAGLRRRALRGLSRPRRR